MVDRPGGLPPFESRPTVRLDHGMPEKASVIGLSDSAFRLMVEAICYASRNETDGRVPKGYLRRVASKPSAVTELVTAGHLEGQGDELVLGDYLRWNRSHAEINSFRESRGERGQKGAHKRWHVPTRKADPNCPFCIEEGLA